MVSLVFDGKSTCVCQRLARWLGQVDVVHVRNTKCSNTSFLQMALCQKVVFCTICPLSPGLLSGHGREAGVGGGKDDAGLAGLLDAGLDPFPCHTPTDCRPGTASGVWSCCTPANPVGRRRGPRRRQRRPAAARAAAAGAECARLAAAAVFI